MRKGIPPPTQVLALMKTRREGMKPEQIAKATLPLLFTTDFMRKNREFKKMFVQNLIKAPITQEMLERQMLAVSKFNSFKRLKTINTPTLVIHGLKDILLPPQNSNILAENIPGAKLVLFDDAAHIVFQPEPEKVLGTVVEFLK
jgi:pimeloyl-ACP methyl ester carboxylesterase